MIAVFFNSYLALSVNDPYEIARDRQSHTTMNGTPRPSKHDPCVGLEGLVGLVGLISGLVRCAGLVGLVGFVGLAGLVEFAGLVELSSRTCAPRRLDHSSGAEGLSCCGAHTRGRLVDEGEIFDGGGALREDFACATAGVSP
jgi:hypothetical protein